MSEYRDADHIKSYVIRAARMSPAQQSAYERLKPTFCVPYRAQPCDPRAFFPHTERPLYLEIGFGMGDATAEMAQAAPETNFLGVEVHKPGVGKLLHQVEQRGLANVRVIHEDALLVVEHMIAPSSLDAVLLFFPDPWPKKRHHKRRIVRDAFVALLTERIRPGGFFYMVTDWVPYAEWSLEVLSRAPGLRNAYPGFARPRPWRPETAFERKGVSAGHEIRELYFVRPD